MSKIIIFDFDGTLADTHELSYEVYKELSNRHQIKLLSKEEIDNMSHLSIQQRLKKHGVPFYKLPGFIRESLNIYHGLAETAPLFKGMDHLIEYLHHQGYNLAIVSSNSVNNIRRFIETHNIDYFQHIYGKASLFGKGKKIVKLLRNIKVSRHNSLYIGDEYRDIVAAKKKKIKIVAVNWGYDHIDLIKKGNPNYVAETVEELKTIIDKWHSNE